MNMDQGSSQLALHTRVLIIAAVVAAALSTLAQDWRFAHQRVSLMLLLLALIAELIPVSLSRSGLRVTFTLPFLAGLAQVNGIIAVIIADVAVTLVASCAHERFSLKRVRWSWVMLNCAVSTVTVAIAIVAMRLVEMTTTSQGFNPAATLTFTVVYTAVNFLLVTHFYCLVSRERMSSTVIARLKPGVIGLALYSLVSLCVVSIVTNAAYWCLPLTFAPVLALRAVLRVRAQMDEQYYETITALNAMLQRAHPYTHGHLERVAKMAEQVGLRLGLNPTRARLVREAAILHDIGKIAIDEAVLDKPARLTEEEMEHVRLHPEFGAMILAKSGQFAPIVEWVRHHHERLDGSGYPDKLTDKDIPIESKIIAVVDAYDAMVGGPKSTDQRSYRVPLEPLDALVELERCAGTQFDPVVVDAFRKTVLHSGRRARWAS